MLQQQQQNDILKRRSCGQAVFRQHDVSIWLGERWNLHPSYLQLPQFFLQFTHENPGFVQFFPKMHRKGSWDSVRQDLSTLPNATGSAPTLGMGFLLLYMGFHCSHHQDTQTIN